VPHALAQVHPLTSATANPLTTVHKPHHPPKKKHHHHNFFTDLFNSSPVGMIVHHFQHHKTPPHKKLATATPRLPRAPRPFVHRAVAHKPATHSAY
jgi:hypothetical protein